jgi:hypothetical protein
MRHLLIMAFAMVVLAGCCPEREIPAESTSQDFPFAQGTIWVYQGMAKWTQAKTGEVVESPVTWKMEVTEILEREHVRGAVLKGHPWDLSWYEEGKERGDYLMIRVGPGKYYLLNGKEMDKALGALRTEGELLHGLVGESEIFLDLPLSRDKFFGEADQITRTDRSYCWFVDGEEDVALEGVSGIPPTKKVRQYRLRYETRPDHTVMHFVSGVGITRFEYVHHGTVSECDLRLSEYRPGRP